MAFDRWNMLSLPRILGWASRFAVIPLIIYSLGIPLMLYVHGSLTLWVDRWLPFELVGLALCAGLVSVNLIGSIMFTFNGPRLTKKETLIVKNTARQKILNEEN